MLDETEMGLILPWEQEVGGSNPPAPIEKDRTWQGSRMAAGLFV